MFVDRVRIFVKAGPGGDGACSFRREKYVPHGGPDGGDGGDGGDVRLVASQHLSTLLDLRYQQQYMAKAGGRGEGSNRHGKTAPAIVIPVPVGTIVYDDDTAEVLADLVEPGQTYVAAEGGRGGRGNARFATSTNRVPTRCEPGTPGEERWLRLELKLLADVGLVGFPNAGKSTLISALSAARPKVADYPFTTLSPNLGVVAWGQDQQFVVADIPGLIEGAHAGKGLGLQFLRHIERTRVLLHLIDISEWAPNDPLLSFEVMRRELEAYNPALVVKPFAIVGTKIDIQGDGHRLSQLRAYCADHSYPFFSISAATGEGLEPLKQFVGRELEALKPDARRTDHTGETGRH